MARKYGVVHVLEILDLEGRSADAFLLRHDSVRPACLFEASMTRPRCRPVVHREQS